MSKMITNQDRKAIDKFKWKLDGAPALVLDLQTGQAEPHTRLDFGKLSMKDERTTTLTIISLGAGESEILDSTLNDIDRYACYKDIIKH